MGEICREGIPIPIPPRNGGYIWVFGFGFGVSGIHASGLFNHPS